jgi:hypothetical protein
MKARNRIAHLEQQLRSSEGITQAGDQSILLQAVMDSKKCHSMGSRVGGIFGSRRCGSGKGAVSAQRLQEDNSKLKFELLQLQTKHKNEQLLDENAKLKRELLGLQASKQA